MSKRMIAVEIDPHEDGVRCGECRGVSTDEDNEYCAWAEQNWDEKHKGPFMKNLGDTRGPACLAAERKLAQLVEAGEAVMHRVVETYYDARPIPNDIKAWDRAIDALKGGE